RAPGAAAAPLHPPDDTDAEPLRVSAEGLAVESIERAAEERDSVELLDQAGDGPWPRVATVHERGDRREMRERAVDDRPAGEHRRQRRDVRVRAIPFSALLPSVDER